MPIMSSMLLPSICWKKSSNLAALAVGMLIGGQAQAQSDACGDDLATAPNLLRNTSFTPGDNGVPEQWHLTQHAGDAAYTVTFDDGVMTVDKYGEQYWLQLTQQVDATNLAGKTVILSAEIKLDMHAENWHETLIPGGGLILKVMGGFGDPFGRTRVVQHSMLEHEPRLGQTDWTQVSVRMRLKEEATDLRAGFMHQAYGKLSVRAPRLVQWPESCGSDADTSDG